LTTAEETGNSDILSYQVYWDNGDDAAADLDILLEDDLVLSRTVYNLQQGKDYRFKVRARNIYGYGDYSDVATIRASDVPDAMDIVNTIQVGTEILVVWSAPPDGGDTITAYQIDLYNLVTKQYHTDLTYCDGSV
jgi:hypothetical protein